MKATPSAAAEPPASAIRTLHTATFVLFFLSGACGLVYEVLWCRQLGLIFGNTVQSLSAVLTAFMAGLALGSYLAGRLCHRLKRPLLAYGILELCIGAYCAALPWLFSDHGPIVPVYRTLYGETGSGSLSIVRFAISLVLLLIPTTFMGATLPVLSQYLSGIKTSLGRTVGALYAVNTFGAVAGAAATGFFLLPNFGKSQTNWIAVGCNVMLGVLAINLGLRQTLGLLPAVPANAQKSQEPSAQSPEPISAAVKMTVAAFAITGFAGMATQIAWTRAISLSTGSSTYAFSLIVSVFILGLSLGGAWAARVAPKTLDPLALLAKILLVIGLLGLAISVLLGIGPILFFFLLAWSSQSSWWVLLVAEAFGIGLIILLPTFLMGATLPLTMQVAARYRESAGRTVGTIYAVNTIGAILGSFLGGLVLLPLLTIQYTLVVAALMYAIPGLLLMGMISGVENRKPRFLALALVVVVAGLVCVQPWDGKIMSSGVYLLYDPRAIQLARDFHLLDALPNLNKGRELLYYKEGASATVAVVELDTPKGKDLMLSVGGKPDASSRGDMSTQIGLTLIPEMLHEKGPEDVLVIGLGSGVSVGAALAPESVKRVDVVEMSPEVVEASEKFHAYNELSYVPTRPWLQTPKVELLINDGRNHLLLTSRRYDVIASEPSNPWMAGVGNLFTREAFELTRSCLKPGGIMCQWVHSYRLEQTDFHSIIRTFIDVYPYAQFWNVGDGDYLLIGSETSLIQPLERLRARLREPKVAGWLSKVHYDNEAEFLSCYLVDRVFMDEMTDPARTHTRVHTDDNMLLEFSAPRSLYSPVRTLRAGEFIPDPEEILKLDALSSAERESFVESLDWAVSAREHERLAMEGRGSFADHVKAALELSPQQRWANDNKDRQDTIARPQTEMLAQMKEEADTRARQAGGVLPAADLLCRRTALDPLNLQTRGDAAEGLLNAAREIGSYSAAGAVRLERVSRRMGREILKLGGSRTVLKEALDALKLSSAP
jgi:spermidine synthase